MNAATAEVVDLRLARVERAVARLIRDPDLRYWASRMPDTDKARVVLLVFASMNLAEIDVVYQGDDRRVRETVLEAMQRLFGSKDDRA